MSKRRFADILRTFRVGGDALIAPWGTMSEQLKNGHIHTVGFRADVGIGPYEIASLWRVQMQFHVAEYMALMYNRIKGITALVSISGRRPVMKKWCALIGAVAAVCLILIAAAYPALNTPPDAAAMERYVDENWEDIQVLLSFLQTSGYTDVYISAPDKPVFADFRSIEISDSQTCEAVGRLMKRNAFRQIDKMDGNVFFLKWVGLQDIGCGVMYAENPEEAIEQEFLTEVVPLPYEGWYYYVSDYNAWRSGRRATTEMLTW